MSTDPTPVPDRRRRHGSARAGRSRRGGQPRPVERRAHERPPEETDLGLAAWIPRGRGLPTDDWVARHRLITWVLALHLPAIVLYARYEGFGTTHGLAAATPSTLLLAAAIVPGGRRVRSAAASLGLFCCSAVLVHLAHGAVEMHFHYFVVVGLVALYEDWTVYLVAIAFVGVESGLVGGLVHNTIYDRAREPFSPWVLAGINAGFVFALASAQVVFWHYNAQSRRRVEVYRERLYTGQQSLMVRLEETDRIRSDLVATVSHEFRTPLTGIRLALLTLRRRRDKLSTAQVNDMIDSAVSYSERLSRLLENMLTAATATGTDETTTADLPDVVADVLATLAYSAATAESVIVDMPRELPVRMSRQALHQVVANLVDNALIHSWPGAPVRLIGGRVGDEVVLRVRNPGPDLDPATIRQLFEPFTQRDNSATRQTDGAGMGLYVVRRLVEVHGGRLRMASENGEIIVEVDLWAADAPPAAAPAPPAVAPMRLTSIPGYDDAPQGLTGS